MSQSTICVACGRDATGANYCPNCGASMDEETQREIDRERRAQSERQRLAGMCEELTEYCEQYEETDTLARIKQRIEAMPLDRFMEENDA